MSCWSGPSQSPQSQWIRERLLLPVSPAGPSAPQSQEGPVASGPGTEQAINTHARAHTHTHTHTPPKGIDLSINNTFFCLSQRKSSTANAKTEKVTWTKTAYSAMPPTTLQTCWWG